MIDLHVAFEQLTPFQLKTSLNMLKIQQFESMGVFIIRLFCVFKSFLSSSSSRYTLPVSCTQLFFFRTIKIDFNDQVLKALNPKQYVQQINNKK